MTVKQFQRESKVKTPRADEPAKPERFALDRIAAAATAGINSEPRPSTLLLGLMIREWLFDDEQQYLDSLPPENSISFLIHGDTYLHPSNVRLFPMELVDATRIQGGDAVFTQRYRPEHARTENAYLVYTALLNPGENTPMVFGFFGPEYDLSQPNVDVQFCSVVARFRSAYREVAEMTPRIKSKLGSTSPCMLVDQTSGLVLAVNRQATSLLGERATDIVGHDYYDYRDRLAAAVENAKIKMENVAGGDMSLSMITMVRGDNADNASGRSMADHFFHTCRNKLTGITAATSMLASMKGEVVTGEEIELAEAALQQADEINNLLERFSLLLGADRMPAEPT